MAKFSVMDTLNKQSKNKVTSVVTTRNTEVNSNFTVEIPIDKIVLAKDNKNKYGIRDIDELAADIEQFGLMHNIVVKSVDEEGNYELISGERRWRAYNLLAVKDTERYKTIPSKVERHDNSLVQELRLIQANATARVLTDYEKTTQASRIKDILHSLRVEGYKFKGRMRDIVADILKVSPAQMGRMESIDTHLSPEFKKEFKEGKIGITNAYEISRQDKEKQKATYEEFMKTGEIKKNEPVKPHTMSQGRAVGEDNNQIKDVIVEEQVPQNQEGQGYVNFLDVDGTPVEIYGDLIFIIAVDKGESSFDVAFPFSKNVKSLDYATLSQVVILECIKGIGKNKETLLAMKNGIKSIFDKMG